MSNGPFTAWFKAQFGALPLPEYTREKKIEELRAAEKQVAKLQQELEANKLLSEQFTAALYVWQIKDADKTKTQW